MPLLGAPVLAIVLGAAVSAARRPGQVAAPGLRLVSTRFLQAAVVLLGATLSLGEILHVGARSLPVMLGTLAAALAGAALLGRLLAVSPRLRTLIGVGTGICGASAIAAVSGIVEATSVETAYAITTICLFNVVAVLAFPPLGRLFGLSQQGFGLWTGTAVNDTSSVLAAAFSYGHLAGAQAIVVKLTRTTLIVPVALVLSLLQNRSRPRAWRLIPPFLVLFVLASLLDTVGAIPGSLHHLLSRAALALITLALAAVGLSADVALIRRTGLRPLILGALLWVSVAGTSLALQAIGGQL